MNKIFPMEISNLKDFFPNITKGEFIERKNRFVGTCKIKEKIITCHIADTGRLKEILTPGREILLSLNQNRNLKTDSKLVAAKMEKEGFILINTSVHSKIAEKLIENGILGFIPKIIKREVRVGNSRIDFAVDNTNFIEVKGCNLKSGNFCLFPDAPTKRGTKHIKELMNLSDKGYKAYILMLIFRDTKLFAPNVKTDKDFSETFAEALRKGIKFIGAKIKIDKNLKLISERKLELGSDK